MHAQHPVPPPQSQLASRWLPWIALLFVALWLATLGGRKLLNPDEGRYAEIPREMLATGDWLTPRLNGLKYFEKPPLQYWATAIAIKTLGPTEFAARLWCGLTGLAGIVLVGWLGGRLYGRNAGMIAAALLASSLMYFVLGHLNTLDMGLTFFLNAAIGGFLLAQHAPIGSKAERNFMLVAWAAAALALLSKGIIAAALPVLALAVYTAIERDFSPWRRLHIVPGLLLFLVIGAPWLIAVSVANPEFAEFFFLHEHFARFLTDVHRRVEPWWYFIPFLIAGALPWTSLAAAATVKAWRSDAHDKSLFHTRRFLVIWVAVVVVFFSVSHSKLAPYILPVFSALALLTGDYISRAASMQLRKHLLVIAALWASALGYLVFALSWGSLPQRHGIPPELMAKTLQGTAVAVAIACLGAVIAWALAGRSRSRSAILAASGGTMVALSILIVQFDAARTIRSGFDLAQLIKPHQTPHQTLYSIETYDHSLAFYLGRNVTLVDYNGELEFGQKQEPGHSLASLAAFKQAWETGHSGSLAVMKHDAFDKLSHDGLQMQVIARDVQLTAVKKP